MLHFIHLRGISGASHISILTFFYKPLPEKITIKGIIMSKVWRRPEERNCLFRLMRRSSEENMCRTKGQMQTKSKIEVFVHFFYNKRQQEWLRRWEVDKWRGEKRYKSELRGGQWGGWQEENWDTTHLLCFRKHKWKWMEAGFLPLWGSPVRF